MIWMIPSMSLRMKREEVEFLKEDCIGQTGKLDLKEETTWLLDDCTFGDPSTKKIILCVGH